MTIRSPQPDPGAEGLLTGGGDTPEAVYPALKMAYLKLGWELEHTKVLVVQNNGNYHLGGETKFYLAKTDYEPFGYFWSSQGEVVDRFVRDEQ